MTDEPPFYSPSRPIAARVRTPGEELWRTHRDQDWWSAELRFHGESYGWEAQILRDGELVIGQRCAQRDTAVQWAAEQRPLIERGFQD